MAGCPKAIINRPERCCAFHWDAECCVRNKSRWISSRSRRKKRLNLLGAIVVMLSLQLNVKQSLLTTTKEWQNHARQETEYVRVCSTTMRRKDRSGEIIFLNFPSYCSEAKLRFVLEETRWERKQSLVADRYKQLNGGRRKGVFFSLTKERGSKIRCPWKLRNVMFTLTKRRGWGKLIRATGLYMYILRYLYVCSCITGLTKTEIFGKASRQLWLLANICSCHYSPIITDRS